MFYWFLLDGKGTIQETSDNNLSILCHSQLVQLWVYISLIIYKDIISVAQYILVVEKESGIIL